MEQRNGRRYEATEWNIGIEEGEKKKQIEIAKKMLQRKTPIEEIEEITGLKMQEIQKLI